MRLESRLQITRRRVVTPLNIEGIALNIDDNDNGQRRPLFLRFQIAGIVL